MTDLARMAADPRVYLDTVRIETDGEPRPWGAIADPWQRDRVAGILPAFRRLVVPDSPEPEKRRALWVATRKRPTRRLWSRTPWRSLPGDVAGCGLHPTSNRGARAWTQSPRFAGITTGLTPF